MVSLPSKAEKPWLAKNVLLCLCRSTGVGAQTDIIPELYDLYDLAHVARWEPYNLHHLGHVSRDGFVLIDPAQHVTTAGYDLDRDLSDLSDVDRDLSHLSVRREVTSHRRLVTEPTV